MLTTDYKKKLQMDVLLQQLESDGNDDLSLIMSFGAEAYSTDELIMLLYSVNRQRDTAAAWEHRLFVVGFSISLWLAAAFLCAAFEAHLLSYIFLALVPASLLLALAGHHWLRRRFPAFKDIHLIASIIAEELERRHQADAY
jgi:hypothetical protein